MSTESLATVQSLETFRLSPQQLRLVELQSEREDVGPLLVSARLVIAAEVTPETLAAAWDRVVERFEIFRTVFPILPGMCLPMQAIPDADPSHWLPARDLSDVGSADECTVVDELMAEAEGAKHGALDLARGPLVQLRHVRLGSSRTALLMTLPALLADGPSFEGLARELSLQLEGASIEGEEILQYADLAEWQNRFLEDEETEDGRNFWHSRLCALEPSVLPLARHRHGGAAALHPRRLRLDLDAALGKGLADAARDRELEVSDLLLAAWAALLLRRVDGASLTLGVTVEGRAYEGLEEAMGPLTKVVPITCAPSPDTTWIELARALRADLEEAAAWQECLSLRAEGSGESQTFFPLAFEFHDRETTGCCRVVETWLWNEPFDLRLNAVGHEAGLELSLDYDPRRLDEGEVELLAEALIAGLTGTPDQHLADLPGLGHTERRALLCELNASTAAPPPIPVLRLFEAWTARNPGRSAVVAEGRTLTYGELDRRAEQLADRLHLAGVGPEVPVVLCLERTPWMLVAILGVWKAGGCYVAMEPQFPTARLTIALEGAAALILDQGATMDLPAFQGETLYLGRETAFASAPEAPSARPPLDLDRLAYVIFTSGSTGTPKKVGVSHRSLLNYTQTLCTTLGALDAGTHPEGLRFLNLTSPATDLGNTTLFPPLVSGGSIELMPYETATDPLAFASFISGRDIDVVKITPAHLAALASGQDPAILPRVCMLVGGEAFPQSLARNLVSLGSAEAGCRFINHYGPTEATVGAIAHLFEGTGPRDMSAWRRPGPTVPIGRPFPNLRAYVLDSSFEPCPVGIRGELLLGGVCLARGYIGQPAETAIRFMPDPHTTAPGERMYRTGDLARFLDLETLECLGRIDHQVKVRGYRVELGEIETALRSLPEIREAVVLFEGEGARGELVAYVVEQQRSGTTEGEDSAALKGCLDPLRERLPAFMIPTTWVPIDAVPLTGNGKIDRRALNDLRQRRQQSAIPYRAPSNAVEATLVEIWCEILGRDRIGIDDNFFAIGGDSILSIQLAARAHQRSLAFKPRALFRHQTIASLATVVSERVPIAHEQGPVVGPSPLTPIQRWFFDLGLARPDHFNQALLFEVEERPEKDRLEACIGRLLAHHDVLRARFELTDSMPQMRFLEPGDGAGSLRWVDLSEVEVENQAAMMAAVVADAQSALDLAAGPPFLATYMDLGADRAGRLLLVSHHLVIDGVSWRILLEDLVRWWHDAAAPALPKTTSFRTWAEHQVKTADGEAIETELTYWLETTDGVVPLPKLAGCEADDFGAQGGAQRLELELDIETTGYLLRDAHESYQTGIQDLLLAGLAQALGAAIRRSTVHVMVEGHGREEWGEDDDADSDLDISRTVGWFTSHYPVALEVVSSNDPGRAITQTKAALRQIPNQGIGYGLLRHLRSRDTPQLDALRRRPRPDVLFNYLGQLDTGTGGAEAEGLRPAREPVGSVHDSENLRTYALQIDAHVRDGRFKALLAFHPERHNPETMGDIGRRWLDALQELVKHCLSGDTGGYETADFEDVDLDEGDLANILAQLGDD